MKKIFIFLLIFLTIISCRSQEKINTHNMKDTTSVLVDSTLAKKRIELMKKKEIENKKWKEEEEKFKAIAIFSVALLLLFHYFSGKRK